MSTVVNIHEAKTHFSRLVERAERGERITIARAGRPVAILVAIEPESRFERPIGMDRGRVIMHDTFDDPVPEWEGRGSDPEDPMSRARS